LASLASLGSFGWDILVNPEDLSARWIISIIYLYIFKAYDPGAECSFCLDKCPRPKANTIYYQCDRRSQKPLESVIFIGERRNFTTRIIDKIGDCSYGLYLFGWPAEQMVKQLTDTSSPMTLLLISVPIAFALALFSCHFIEGPAMRLRKSATRIIESSWEWATTAVPATRTAAEWSVRVSFIMAALLTLMSEKQWWYFVESMSMIVIATITGAFIGITFLRIFSRPNPRVGSMHDNPWR
jgi:hypothetical protein